MPDPPVSGTMKLTHWSRTADVNGEEFTEDTPISSDIRVYAIGETMYGEGEGQRTFTLTYGEPTQPLQVDLSQYAVMGDGSDPKGKFRFTITDGGIDSVRITGETLEIAADVPANEEGHRITIRAFKTSSDPVLMATALGSESFLFTLTVVVHKAEPAYTVPEGLSAALGATLADVALPEGWHWADETQTVEEGGTNTFDAVYTPEDSANYQTVTVPLSVGIKTYSVTLELNGGTVNSGDVNSYTAGLSTPLPTDVTRPGYRFGGWYDNAALAGTAVVEIPADAAEDKVFYAKWLSQSVGPSGPVWPVPLPTPTPTPQPPEEEPQEELRFADVKKTDWFYKAVQKVYTAGLMNGVSDTVFAPELEITRGMAVTILYRMENEPEADFFSTFEDCPGDMYFKRPVIWANNYGIVNGYSAARFAPYDRITREQMATIVYRYAVYRRLDLSTDEPLSYLDSGAISDYALEPVRWVTEHGIMEGNGTNYFFPQNYITRAESAAVFQRILELLEPEEANDTVRP